jgi:NAD(P)H-hydrate epimerase
MKIFNKNQTKYWDEFTIKHDNITSIDLMENAASACVEWFSSNLKQAIFHIICGPGNNGGDGFAIARLLAKKGKEVHIYLFHSEKYSEENLINQHKLKAINLNLLTDIDVFFNNISAHDVLVDALFGTGLNKNLSNQVLDIIIRANKTPAHKIAIDISSGLDADHISNHENTIAFKANDTLCFERPKLAFLFPENDQFVGKFHILKIGLSPEYDNSTNSKNHYIDIRELNFIKNRTKFSHKGSFGHSLLITGSKGKMGAATLAASACLKSGTGLLTVFSPEIGQNIIQISVPEAMFKNYGEDIFYEKYAAIGIGSGLGTSVDARSILTSLIAEYNQPLVIDADAITILSELHEIPFLPENSILTPHPKEFERLFGKYPNRAEQIKKGIEVCTKYNCYIVLKGAHTAIICPDENVYFNSTGNPAMAKGGSGDALTGILTSLLAQGYHSREACILGVYLHGYAGDVALQMTSEISMLPSDLINHLGVAYNNILNSLKEISY